MMKKNPETRAMLRQIVSLSWPVMVEQAMSTVIQMVDAAMVGSIGAAASASVGMTATVNWLVNSPISAMGVGVLAVVARASGAGDERTVRRAGGQAVWLALVVGALLGAITLSVGPFLPRWLGADEELWALGSAYFMIISAPMILRSFTMVFGYVLRAVHDVRTTMLVNALINILNVVLNFFLIFGTRTVSLGNTVLTVPGAGWGVRGAAAATAISMTVGGVVMLAALLRNPLVSPIGHMRPDKRLLLSCVRIGIPVAATRVVTCLGHVVFASQVTRLGTTSLAAHSIALTAEEAFYIPGYGMQAAASTLCGNALGENDERKLRGMAWSTSALCAALMAVSGAVLFAIPARMMALFTPDEQVVRLGASVLRMVALSEPFFGVSVILEGVFNGIGDTRTPLILSTATMWGARILPTAVCISLLGLGLTSVWLCMIADNVLKCLLLAVIFAQGGWRRRVGLANKEKARA